MNEKPHHSLLLTATIQELFDKGQLLPRPTKIYQKSPPLACSHIAANGKYSFER